VSRLRATGVIKPGDTTVIIAFGDFKPTVHVVHRHFPHGGSWSFFLCPSCGRRVRTLRLHEGRIVCRMCDGLRAASRTDKVGVIERLKRLLYGGGKIQRRARLERSLRRKIIVQRRKRLGLPP
jgi:hypothetical protein